MLSNPVQTILVINLSPRESECILCGTFLSDPRRGLPMYEGEVVPDDWPGEWAGFDVCEHCYAKHRPPPVLKPTRPYGDIFEYDNTPLAPGARRAVLCNGHESTWQPTVTV